MNRRVVSRLPFSTVFIRYLEDGRAIVDEDAYYAGRSRMKKKDIKKIKELNRSLERYRL